MITLVVPVVTVVLGFSLPWLDVVTESYVRVPVLAVLITVAVVTNVVGAVIVSAV